MRLSRTIMGIAIIAAFLIQANASAQYGWRKLGDKAPELNVYMMQGDEISIAEGKGKRVFVIEFWATWCAPCKFSIPHLSYLQKKYKEEGLVIVGISDESSGLVRPYMDAMAAEMTYPVAVDRSDTTTARYRDGYGVDAVPVAFVVDVNGRVSWYGNPMDAFMEEHLRVLLADVPEEAKAELAVEAAEAAEAAETAEASESETEVESSD